MRTEPLLHDRTYQQPHCKVQERRGRRTADPSQYFYNIMYNIAAAVHRRPITRSETLVGSVTVQKYLNRNDSHTHVS